MQTFGVLNLLFKNKMIKQITIFILLCISCVCASGQTENYNAPVKWENYKIGERGASISLPKLPVLVRDANLCKEEENNQYAAYAEGAVYGLNVYYKTERNVPPARCSPKRSFSKSNFEERLNEIRSSAPDATEETRFTANGLEGVKLKRNTFIYWLFNDFKNKRWFEVWVAARQIDEEKNIKIRKFVESLKIEKNPSGIEIGEGAPRTLGDGILPNKTGVDAESSADSATTKKETVEKFRIILKPRAGYTELARKENQQGTVRVRVTFLASGAIGSVAVVEGLPFGLTEQAIAAAKKMVFIPANKNGVNYSVIAQVEYKFLIY